MKVQLDSRWVRLVLELFPELPVIRRYRAVPSSLDAKLERAVRRRVQRRLRHQPLQPS
jgi:hypothetical protein